MVPLEPSRGLGAVKHDLQAVIRGAKLNEQILKYGVLVLYIPKKAPEDDQLLVHPSGQLPRGWLAKFNANPQHRCDLRDFLKFLADDKR